MPELACQCGGRVQVEIWQAGTTCSCPECGAAISVPDSITLKRLAGDEHPYWNDWQRLEHALETGGKPFDGTCHGCGVQEACIEVPIELAVMSQRDIRENSPPVLVTPCFTWISVSGGSEHWRTVRFPLLLCNSCYSTFVSSTRWSRFRKAFLVVVTGVLVLIPLMIVALVLGLWILLVALFFAYFAWRRRSGKNVTMRPWLSQIPLVTSILSQEDEYVIRRLRARQRDG